jgi:hypothetical protein
MIDPVMFYIYEILQLFCTLAVKMLDTNFLKGDEKLKVLNKIAEVAYQQGNYHLATKKWTQAGNRLQVIILL